MDRIAVCALFADAKGNRVVRFYIASASSHERWPLPSCSKEADVLVHAERRRQEDAAPGRDRGEAVEELVERRLPGAARVDVLDLLAGLGTRG